MDDGSDRLDQHALSYDRLDDCREFAASLLDRPGLPDADRIRAAGVLNALEAADHTDDLLIVKVERAGLITAALHDHDQLWARYGNDESEARHPTA